MADFINSNITLLENHNNRYEILTPDGFKPFVGLLKGENTTISLSFSNGSHIECTPEHKIVINSALEYKYAKDLKVGDFVYSAQLEYIHATSIVNNNKEKTVYELLEVKDNHAYIANYIISKNCLLLDEFSFIPNNIADEFISSVYPTISSGKTSKIIMVSTPKGLNHFYNIWSKAIKGENNFMPIKINWWEVPGRDEEWKKATIADIGAVRFSQEFECCAWMSSIYIRDTNDVDTTMSLKDLYEYLKD